MRLNARLRALVVALILGSVFLGSMSPAAAFHRHRALTDEEAAVVVGQYVNAWRLKHDLAPLATSSVLSDLAEEWAASGPVRVHHTSAQLLAVASFWSFYRVGENMAQIRPPTPGLLVRVVNTWAQSPAHYAVLILPGIDRMGVAVRHRGDLWNVVLEVAAP